MERIRITRKRLDKAHPLAQRIATHGAALILILTVQLMAEAGVGGKETTLPCLPLRLGTCTGDYRAPLMIRGDL